MFLFGVFAACLAISTASDVNQKCTTDTECDSYGQYCQIWSNCDGNGQCACKDGYAAFGTTCKLVQIMGGICDDTNTICPIDAGCQDGKCTCISNFRPSPNKKICVELEYQLLGQACTTANCAEAVDNPGDNRENVECVDGKCACRNGHKEVDGACVLYGNGESCDDASKLCNTGLSLECKSGTCQCNDNPAHVWYPPQSQCVDSSSIKNIKEGDICVEGSNDPSNRYCAAGLTCTTCPGQSNKECRIIEGSGSEKVTISTMLVLVSSGILYLLH